MDWNESIQDPGIYPRILILLILIFTPKTQFLQYDCWEFLLFYNKENKVAVSNQNIVIWFPYNGIKKGKTPDYDKIYPCK